MVFEFEDPQISDAAINFDQPHHWASWAAFYAGGDHPHFHETVNPVELNINRSRYTITTDGLQYAVSQKWDERNWPGRDPDTSGKIRRSSL
jgi:hypothetical protein